MPYKSKNNVNNEHPLIKEFNRMQGMISSAIKDSNYNAGQTFYVYLIESDWIDNWKKSFMRINNKKDKTFKEPCKIINNFDKMKTMIYEGKKFDLVFKDFINNFVKKNSKIVFEQPVESYFGNKKFIIYFDNNCVLVIIKNDFNLEKYFVTKLNLGIIKKDFIKRILDIKINIFFKESKFRKNNIEFLEINILKEQKQDISTNKKIIINPNETIKLNELINLENKNPKINSQSNNNNQINESIQESLPYDLENIKKNQESQIISNNINNPITTNTENIPNQKEESNNENHIISQSKTSKEKQEEEKDEFYENEKFIKSYEKKIGEELYNNLVQTDLMELNKQKTKKIELITEICNTNNEIRIIENDIKALIEKKNKIITNYKNSLNKKDKDNITKEQIMKRDKLDKKYIELRFQEINEKIDELNIKKEILEKKLDEQQNELNDIDIKIQIIQESMLERKNMQYKRTMLEKSVEDTNLLNLINKDKEELKNLQYKLRRREHEKYEQEMVLEAQRQIREKKQKEKEEQEKILYDKKMEEINKKLKEEEKKKKMAEREEDIHRKKIEESQIKQKIENEKIELRYEEINQIKENDRAKYDKEKEEIEDKYKKFLEQKIKEENMKEKERKKKEERDYLWKNEMEESEKRQKLNGKEKLNNLINTQELKEIKEEIKEEEEIGQSELVIEEKQKKENEKEKKEEKEKNIINEEEIKKLKELKEIEEKEKEIKKKLDEIKIKEIEEKIKQEAIRKKQMEEEKRKKIELEEKIRKEELRKKKEFEEKMRQEELGKKIELEEKIRKEELKKKKELEEKKKKEEEIKKQKELMEKIKQEQLKKQKELEQKNKLEEEIKKKKDNQINQNQLNQNQFNQNPNPKVPITCKSFKSPPLIGLQNIGSTCYMNATLQCFSNTEVLTNYFLNEKNFAKIYNNNIAKKNPQLLQLSPSYLDLINNLWIKKQKWYPPTTFRKRLADMNPLFKEGTPNDAKDLLTYILMQLHEELNSYDISANNFSENDENVNQYNEQEVLQSFVKGFFGKNKSVLSDQFFGIQESKFLCLGCEKKNMGLNQIPIKYNFQTFNFLIFPLEEIRKFKNNNNLMNNMQMVNNMNQNQFNMFQFNNNFNNFQNNNIIINNIMIQNNNMNSVNINDCFDYFQKDEIFQGENAMWCNVCNGLIPCKNKTLLYTGPNILIMILNRGQGIQFKVKMEFYEKINLDKYIIQRDKPNMNYELYGVVTHLGESGENGHFVASCKSPCNNKWYRFNDAIISPINNVQQEIIDFGNPYILFYKKCE